MSEFIQRENWAKGINNRDNSLDVAGGFVRDSVNVDHLSSGVVALRSGFQSVYTGTNVRGALGVGDYVLVADGEDLVAFNAASDSATVVGAIAGAGLFAGDVLNGELFFATENQCLRFKQGVLRRWGVPTVTAQPVPSLTTGGLMPGTYQVAMTWMNDFGEEGGTRGGVSITVAEGQAIEVTLPAMTGYTPRLYVSAVNGATFYLQDTGAGNKRVNSVRDDLERLETMHLREPVPSAQIVTQGSMMLMVDGSVLWNTMPMAPHLRQPMRGFAQFAEPIGFVGSVDDGAFVSADRTFFLRGVESDEPQLVEVQPTAGVPGTLTKVPTTDGKSSSRVAWMTKDGLAIGSTGGAVELVSQANFAPQLAATGSSGIVVHNGNQQAVTVMRGGKGSNPLAASDSYEAEIVPT